MRGMSPGVYNSIENPKLNKKLDRGKSETVRGTSNKEVIDGASEVAKEIIKDGKIYSECEKIVGNLMKKYGSIYRVPWDEYEKIHGDFGVKYEVIAAICKKIWEDKTGHETDRKID